MPPRDTAVPPQAESAPSAQENAAHDACGEEHRQNYALLLSYDGAPFQGWQIQDHGPSLQGRLEEALQTITRCKAKVYGSGRTDAGVHALNQVANVFLPPGQNLRKLQASLNGLLAPAISVKAVAPIASHFHARHRACGKHYRYLIFNRPYPPVFGRQRCWWLKAPLDVAAMAAAAPHLLGRHDFSAFRARQCEATDPVRTLERLEIVPMETPEGTLSIELEANAFLQHMARVIVGTLVAVGQGKLAAERMPSILESCARENAAATAPAAGLYLVAVRYDLNAYPELRAFDDA